MKELYGVATVTAALIATIPLLGGSPNVVAAESAPPTGIKNVVLVHGAFADGSGWEAVAKILQKDGYTVSVAQPPETSYAEDVKYAKAAVDAMDGPVVIVGHSYGGSIITEAGNDPKASALVYIAAFAPDDGESPASIEQALPQVPKPCGLHVSSEGNSQAHRRGCHLRERQAVTDRRKTQ
jgi:pimeloyl-ACP methyl ester carboxylesterase